MVVCIFPFIVCDLVPESNPTGTKVADISVDRGSPPFQATMNGDKTMLKEPEVLAVNAREASRMLGVCEKTLWNWAKAGLIRTVKVGRRVLYPTSALNEFLDKGASESPK